MRSWETIAAWTWTILILVGCWTPGDQLPGDEMQSSWKFPIAIDKIAHMSMFSGFGFLWIAAFPSRRHAWRVAVAGVILAIVTELGQAIPAVHRDPDVRDAMYDVIGLLIGMGLYGLISWWSKAAKTRIGH